MITFLCHFVLFQSDIIVELMNVCKLKGEYVTVLTPYSAQVECIKRSLQDQSTSHKRAKDYRTASKLDLVKVQTINDSQGWYICLIEHVVSVFAKT